jgi:predicted outer membrane repeat protein
LINVVPGVYLENLTINRDLSIKGVGAGLVIIDGNGQVTNQRVITITSGADVTISGVTIQNGYPQAGAGGGGGILNHGDLRLVSSVVQSNTVQAIDQYDSGGGIYSQLATLVIDHVTLISNTAYFGGGVRSTGVLTISNSTLERNHATKAGGALSAWGPTYLENVTTSDNTAAENGGGIRNDEALVLVNCTLAGDHAPGSRSIYNAGFMTLTNTIIASDLALFNCGGNPLVSTGHNLDSGHTCGLNATGDITDTDPLLGPLRDNGGETWTRGLLPGSPVINQGDDSACPETDQRGQRRVGTCDIGAFEYARWVYLPLVLRGY